MSDSIKRASRSTASSSVAATATTEIKKQPSSQKSADGFMRVQGPASKKIEKKAQYIVVESAEAAKILGSRLAPRPFNPKLQQGNGWKVVELTQSEVRALEAAGVTLRTNERVSVAKPTPILPVAAPRTSLFRDVHGITALQSKEEGWEGEGVCLTVVDTGIGKNNDLMVPAKFDNIATAPENDPPSDGHGHGTHCSGSSTARGDLSVGGIRGMAPKATLQGVKVLSDSGSGSIADVMKGIERAIEWAKTHDGPTVVSMSLGGPPVKDPANDPMNKIINEAVTKHGIYFSIAAGNDGTRAGAVANPGDAAKASTIAAFDHKGTVDDADDSVATFSQRGKAGSSKPTHGADGVKQMSTLPNNRQGEMSGTSMATPVNAGGVACLLGKAWAMFKAGKLKIDPRELVKNGELDKIIAKTAVNRPSVPDEVEGAGDVRFDKAAELLIKTYGIGV
jgi:subtilisin family serine protease